MRRPPPLVMIGWELDAVTLPATRPRAWWERLLGLRAPHDADLLRPATPAARLLRYRDAAAESALHNPYESTDQCRQRAAHYLELAERIESTTHSTPEHA